MVERIHFLALFYKSFFLKESFFLNCVISMFLFHSRVIFVQETGVVDLWWPQYELKFCALTAKALFNKVLVLWGRHIADERLGTPLFGNLEEENYDR